MGDRGNIVIRQGNTNHDDIWFYTHWLGYRLPEIVKGILQDPKAQKRIDDGPYFARIAFCQLIAPHFNEEAGFGISTHLLDNEYPVLVIDLQQKQVVEISSQEADQFELRRLPDDLSKYPACKFVEFVTDSVPS